MNYYGYIYIATVQSALSSLPDIQTRLRRLVEEDSNLQPLLKRTQRHKAIITLSRLYHNFHGNYSDGLHSLISSIQTIKDIIFMDSNFTHFLHIPKIQRQLSSKIGLCVTESCVDDSLEDKRTLSSLFSCLLHTTSTNIPTRHFIYHYLFKSNVQP